MPMDVSIITVPRRQKDILKPGYLDQLFTRTVRVNVILVIKSGGTSLSMEEEVEYLVPPLNGYPY